VNGPLSVSSQPLTRPPPLPSIPPFERIDTLQIKKQLHDELGEDGLKYWTAFQAYIKGSIARAEFMNMGRAEGWLKGSKRRESPPGSFALGSMIASLQHPSLPQRIKVDWDKTACSLHLTYRC
jgi:hypothetical protein